MKFRTKQIHAGVEPDPVTGAILTPIYQTTTYVQPSVDESRGHDMCHGSGSTPSRMARVLCRYISPRWRVRSATVRPGQLGTAALGSVGTTARSRAKSIARQSRNREVSTPNSSAHLNGLMPAVDID